MPTYTWKPSTDTVSYILEKSIDRGLTWAALATITHDYSGADYDASIVRFFYDDGAAVLGEWVRIYGQNAEGDGEASYLHGPVVSTATCHLFGVLQHAVTGDPLRDVRVSITPSNRVRTTLQPGQGVPGTNTATLLGGKREFTVFSDDEGKWSIDLVRGITVTVTIPDVGFEQGFFVPEDRDTLNIVDAYIYRSMSRIKGALVSNWSQGPRYVP